MKYLITMVLMCLLACQASAAGASGGSPEVTPPVALNVSINGIGPPIDPKAYARVMQVVSNGVKLHVLDRFVVHGRPLEGGFFGCVAFNPGASATDVLALENRLLAIRPNLRTAAYSVGRTASCAPLAAPSDFALAFSTIEVSQRSGIVRPRQSLVQFQEDWDQLWLEHKSIFFPLPATPTVDFSRKMVVGVFLGERSNGCYRVNIESVGLVNNEKIVVRYRETAPFTEAFCLTVFVQPNHLILIDRTTLPVEFEELPSN